MDHHKSKIAIVGAGPCGLSMMRSFSKHQGGIVPSITCFEKQSDWGGMWNLTWRTGLDEYGEPVHGSMYKHLWSNGPKECLEYADYTFDEHFSKPITSFPTREILRNYIVGRAEMSDFRQHIQFNTVVRYVEYDALKEVFQVRVSNLSDGQDRIESFDFVIVAIGHFSVPNTPCFYGIDTFPGRVLHSHDFRDASQFKGQDVLIIGSSYSAEDIALQAYKFGAKSIIVSYRSKAMSFKWPPEIQEVPLLSRIVGSSVHFTDGTERRFDTIVLCTGYLHHFPFMSESLRLNTKNRLYPDQLYKGIFFQDQPKLVYLGMQDLYFSMTLFDAQAWYVRDVILGRIAIPSAAERAHDMAGWQARESLLAGPADEINFQAAYVADLVAATGYSSAEVVSAGADILHAWEHDKKENILTYRDKSYISPITGTMASPNPIPWIDAKPSS